jgi:peptidyl-prolyl cis-trans isomerase SurA
MRNNANSLRSALVCTALIAVGVPARAAHHRHQAVTDAASVVPDTGSSSGETALPTDKIVATVNGDAITENDVTSREKLFALSTGMKLDPGLLARLRPQITQQLIDEKLRIQEIQRRKIVVTPEEINEAIASIEQRNGLKPHGLQDKLEADGVSAQTLIDQIRVQLGWTHVLRQDLAENGRVTRAEIAQRQAALKQEAGQPEYDVAEIFIPVDDPTHAEQAEKFASAVIQQLREGAGFGIVAAQFGQNENALEGGELGLVGADRLDPQVLAVVSQMPIGAISNPIRVAGGYDIVTLRAKRTIGTDLVDQLNVRQAFFPFKAKLDPQHPDAQQVEQLGRAKALVGGDHSCGAIEAANKAQGSLRPADPGPLTVEQINPQMKAILAGLQPGQVTKPLVSLDGIAVIGVCSRDQKNMADQSTDQIANQLLSERVELASRHENRDLHRRAVIEMRSS